MDSLPLRSSLLVEVPSQRVRVGEEGGDSGHFREVQAEPKVDLIIAD